MRLLDRVRQQAEKTREAERRLDEERQRLRELVREANEEGIPVARIAREAGLSRQLVSSLVQKR
jgi:hypothetical protein